MNLYRIVAVGMLLVFVLLPLAGIMLLTTDTVDSAGVNAWMWDNMPSTAAATLLLKLELVELWQEITDGSQAIEH